MPVSRFCVKSIHKTIFGYTKVDFDVDSSIHLRDDEEIHVGDYLFFDDDSNIIGHCTPSQFTGEHFKYNTENRVLRLVHFTDIRNIEFIREYGLFSKRILDEKGIEYFNNDELRMEGIYQGICVSVNYENHLLLNSFKRKYQQSKYVTLYIKPSILYDLFPTEPKFRVYFNHNAASSCVESSIIDIEIMFQERFNIKLYDRFTSDWVERTFIRGQSDEYKTTSSQAEVIIYDHIPPEYIYLDEKFTLSIKDSENG
jgi:hypothetical protein